MYILSLYYRNINLDVFSVFLLHCGYKIVKELRDTTWHFLMFSNLSVGTEGKQEMVLYMINELKQAGK